MSIENTAIVIARHRRWRLEAILARIETELPPITVTPPAGPGQAGALLALPDGSRIPLRLDPQLPDIFFALGENTAGATRPGLAGSRLIADQVLSRLEGALHPGRRPRI